MFCKKGVLRNVPKLRGKHLCQSHFLLKLQVCIFVKKESLAQLLSFEICEISKNTFSYSTPTVVTSQDMKAKWRKISYDARFGSGLAQQNEPE